MAEELLNLGSIQIEPASDADVVKTGSVPVSVVPVIPKTIMRFTDHECMDPNLACHKCNPGSFS